MFITDPFIKILIILTLYTIILLLIRFLGVGKKKICEECNNCCPDCNLALNRIKRNNVDKLLFHLTFRIFNSKRYICEECGWEGLRWE